MTKNKSAEKNTQKQKIISPLSGECDGRKFESSNYLNKIKEETDLIQLKIAKGRGRLQVK